MSSVNLEHNDLLEFQVINDTKSLEYQTEKKHKLLFSINIAKTGLLILLHATNFRLFSL
jgi:hypothetical protein